MVIGCFNQAGELLEGSDYLLLYPNDDIVISVLANAQSTFILIGVLVFQ